MKPGSHMSEEAKIKISNAKKGKRHTEETKNKISLALSGVNNPFYGKKHSEETKRLISQKGKGRVPPNKGKHIYNNGYEERIFADNDLIPDNFVKGRLPFTEETIAKMKKSALKENHYRFNDHLNSEKIKRRTENILKSKEANNSFNTAKSSEGVFEKFLISVGIDYKKQYKDERYPFYCDFYIPKCDLFIELNHFVTHGKHPFNPNNQEDLEELKRLNKKFEETKSDLYKAMIECWTIRDVNKMQVAIKNNLNYKVSYNDEEMYNIMKELQTMCRRPVTVLNKEDFE